jgi:hypothetical protein
MEWVVEVLLLLRDWRSVVVARWNRLEILHALLGFNIKFFDVLELLELLL